ncbi:rho guanine nucleotide exchange factor 11-like isoform X2 [Bacillus rossius redtenbacheri]|uniref:rho guanine nucleotide exchange factor 11-like isoform X2 n=1 Tax=Bacillus rossius redtenbacheri TaxID=93214 RepID=UPI002FDEEAD8
MTPSSQVVLSVQQRPSLSPRPVSAAMTSPSLHSRPLHHHHSAPSRSTDRITSPLPVDHEKMRQLECQRVHTIRLMLEKERRYVDALRSELARCNQPRLQQELAGAERRVNTLQEQLGSLTAHHADDADHEYSYPNSKSPSPSGTLIRQLERELDVPPPLPIRNRPLLALHFPCPDPPPPIPPRQFYPHLLCTDGGESHIVDNAHNLHLSPTNNYSVSPHVSPLHTHHRTKSSPDNIHNLSVAEVTKRLLASESMSDLSGSGVSPSRGKSISRSSWDVDSPRVTPPGTPPPPYGGSSTNPAEEMDTLHVSEGQPYEELPAADVPSPETSVSKTNHGTLVHQQPIMSMEDDEMSDQEVSQLEDHGPFKSLNKLWEHNAHLAVFLNYVLSNSDPSSLLFYLVTDLYKEGNAKEMKKWAYEIHSSFLVPYAPLRLSNVDENIAREIDETLMHESDKEEILRKIFWKARSKAKEELNEQLADFQQKRTAGLGTIFGPADAQLDESIHDKNKEMKIVESILLPKLEPYMEDVERDNVDPRRFTTAAALCTVIGKVFGLRGPPASALIERCPTFVSKDKSLKVKLISKTTRKVVVRGHHFVLHQYYTVTYCNHCQLIIWGIGPQGYQCTDCFLNIHRTCVKVVEENCPGPVTKKEKANDRISKLMDKIRPQQESRRKPSSLNSIHYDPRAKKPSEEETVVPTDGEPVPGDRPAAGARGDRRPDPVREGEERPHGDAVRNNEDDDYRGDIQHVPKKPTSTSINRSESYKERMHPKRPQRERRKHSDPNLSSKTSDVDLDPQGLSYNTNSGSSSNSSLSTRSLDSPSNSLEMVSAPRTHEAVTVTLTPSSGGHYDSDLEAEPDPPDWVPKGVDLKSLSDREKKRQDIINELFHSERSHVRNLKVLEQVFYRPMEESQALPADHLQLLFSNLDQMLDIHSQFNNLMKSKKKEGPIVGDVADLLLTMFDGPEGEEFQEAAATFCARQQIALELLKERRRKDAKLNNFLNEAEGNPLCRRLQLKDIIPTGMQRLTKYPLLFENLAKHTEKDTEEYAGVLRALERSKVILNNVNQAKREAEDHQRLSDIQRRLDKSGFEKVDHPMAAEFKNLDITKHRLIHEGLLSWRITNRQKCVDLHVLLLDDVILLLQKQDEKFVLKFYSTYSPSGGPTLSPVIKVSTVLVRPNAADKKALYLVNTSTNGAQIYDLVATSSSERKTWFRHISEAAEAYKTRDGKNRRSEATVTAPTPDNELSDSNLQDKTKESEEPGAEAGKEPGDRPPAAAGVSSSTSTTTLDTEPSASPGDGAPPPPASPDPGPQAGDEAAPRKLAGDGLLSPSLRRRIEPSRIVTEESPLIEPTEVVVCQRPVLTAEPVLTPIEKLRRKDEEIRLALEEKQQLVAEILHVPREEFDTIADLAGEPSLDKDASELVLAAVNQANQLSALLNEVLQVTEEEAVSAASEARSNRASRMPAVPANKLQDISSALNKQLTHLLKLVRDRDEERERLRRELQRSREQLHVMHESHRRSQLAAAPSPAGSRPSSYLSQAGSCDPPGDGEDDTGVC